MIRKTLIGILFTLVFGDALSQCLSISETHVDISCSGGNDGQVTVTVNTGVAPFTYELYIFQPGSGSTLMGQVNTSATSVLFTKGNGTLTEAWAESFGIVANSTIAPGNSSYQVKVFASGTGIGPCEVKTISDIVITEPDELVLTLVSVTASCSSNDGAITVSTAGGVGTYAYTWTGPTNPGDTPNATGLAPGTYDVEVMDDNGCTDEILGIVVSSPLADAALSGDNTICEGQTTNLSVAFTGGTGPYSITIDNGVGTINNYNDGDPIPVSPVATTTYSLTAATDANGCNAQALSGGATITVDPAPTITLGTNPQVCSGTTTADLTYSAVTGSPDLYSIDFDATAEGQGFVDVTSAALPASPIAITIPGAGAAGTYNATLTVSNSTTSCASPGNAITVTINPIPTITLGTNPEVCAGTTTADLTYSAVTGSPDLYSIDFDATAEAEGFADVTNAALPASPISITVPGAGATGTYNATLTVSNSTTACVSATSAITVTINPIPTITLGANPEVCSGTTTADLTYSAVTGSPDQYSIDFDATAEGQGFIDVTNAALLASPISITVPGAGAAGTYNATLTVSNSTTACVSATSAITVTINPIPTITLGANPEVCAGTTTADLTYSAVTETPDLYSIDFDATAEGQGFVDVTNAALPASPISITVPGAGAAGTYNATLTVSNSTTSCASPGNAITVTINPTPTITLGTNPQVCSGTTTADLTYSAVTGSPDLYSIDFDATAEAQGFADVTNAALPASPIAITVPGAGAAGTYNATLTVSNSTTACVSATSAITVTINPIPTITLGANPEVCSGTTTADLTYSAVTGSPDQYSIDFDATAEGQGFIDVTNAALPASPISITVPGAGAAGTYNATLTVSNSATACVSATNAITVTINPVPTITLGANPEVCAGTTSADLTYSAVTETPDLYSIDFDATAEAQGFVDVTNAALPASPIAITVPGAGAAGTYNATLTVSNSTTTCTSAGNAITVTINPIPTITLGTNPQVCSGTTTADLTYSAVTGSPDLYSIDFDAVAEAQGFADVTNAALPASPIAITVPGAGATGTYNATLTVSNSTTACVSATSAITVTINPIPTITLGANPEVCAGTTAADLTYSAVTGSPDQYSIDFDATAEAQGFVDVTNAALPASPISITVPGAGAAGTYNATLTVRNSATTCEDIGTAITVTIIANPTITLGTNPQVCAGTTSADLTYSAVTETPDLYSIDFDATAEAQGFVDVTNAALPASPIAITVPGAGAAGTYNATLTVSNSTTTCTSAGNPITVTINPIPTITLGTNPQVCSGTTTADLTYSAVTGSPDQYSIDFDAAAEAQGFVDVTNAALPASPIAITVPGAGATGTYNATLTVSNSTTACVSAASAITVTINPIPTITLGANPEVCAGTTSADLTYSAVTGSPDLYSIDFDATAEAQGFVDVTNVALPASPIAITVPGAGAAGTYNATLRVRNSATACEDTGTAITVTIIANPTITLGTNPQVCAGTTSADLTYSAVTETPDLYSIDFDATAEAQGFVDVTNAALPASPIAITVPGAGAAGTYNATLTVSNSTTTCTSAGNPITVTINPIPTITLGANPQVCSGLNAELTYSAVTGSPNQYSIDFDAAAEAQGFVDVTNAALPATPIVITVPPGGAAGTYNATLNVRNSATACEDIGTAITVTIIANPTITLGANPEVCAGTTTADLTYSAVTETPDQYSIDFDATAEAQGFVDVTNVALPASPISITVPGAGAAGTYNATLSVRNSATTCVSASSAITVTIIANPTITLGTSPQVCSGTTTANLTYSAVTETPDLYSIDFDATAEAQGFVDVTNAALPASPIAITVPGAGATGTYNATLTVSNSTTTCVSAGTAITVTINPIPAITLGASPEVCSGTTTASLTYSAVTGSPNQYSIDFDAAAEAQGFVDVTNAALPATPIVITVPAGGAAGTYNATLNVRNSATACEDIGTAITVTIIANPTITLGANPEVCAGTTTADLTYSAVTETPDLYSIDFDATAEAQGFIDVVNTALPASPIAITVPGAGAAGTYNATLSVRNSATTCVSAGSAITVTIIANPTITLGTNPQVCSGTTTANLTYSAVTETPDVYTIDFDATAEAQGFVDVVNAALPASPIAITVPGAGAAGTYNATLTVSNSSTTCASAGNSITVTINPIPTITLGANPQVCSGLDAQLTYSAVTGSPNLYSIDFDATAEAQGFVDVVNAALSASPIVITVPSASAGTYNATLSVRNSATGCFNAGTAFSIGVTANPTITLGTSPAVCAGTTTANLTYSAVTETPDQYSIDFDATAEAQGFIDVVNAALPASPIAITVPAGGAAGTYNATLTVRNSATTCVSAGSAFTVTIDPIPTITLGTNPQLCSGTTTADLIYSAVTGSPDLYTIDFDATAEAQGFVDVVNAALPASPIAIAVPGAGAVGTYNATLTVSNSTTTCVSAGNAITVTINPIPAITLGSSPEVCSGTTTADLTYSAATGSPNQYSIDFDATAEAQGFVDVVNGALPASPIVITVPAGGAAGTYNATLNVRNSATACEDIGTAITVTIIANPTITLGTDPQVCSGTTTADLTYSAVTETPDLYSIDFDATAEAQGFVDVVNAALPASPIAITVPGSGAAGTYNATLTVGNSATTCVSAGSAITVTINPIPAITLGANPEVCSGSNAELTYSAATGSPDQYSIDFDATAEAEGFVDVVNAALPASPIGITVPGAAATGAYNATLTVSNSATTCESPGSAITITINPVPTITLGANPEVCSGLPADLTYSAVTGSPDQYSIDFDATAEAQGFVDVVNAALPASPIVITVPGAQAGTYNATLSVLNGTTGCFSAGTAISIGVIANPTITPGTNPQVCSGTTIANLTYSAVTETPDLYSIDFDATAEAQGFVDVVNAALPASPIAITVPVAGAAGTYNATLTVGNSATTCVSAGSAITVTINPIPAITLGGNPEVCSGSNAELTYSAATGSPDLYSIDFDATAEAQGFVDVVNAALPASPIAITVPGAAATGAYNATLTVSNSATTCESPGSAIAITINPVPTITLGANPEICSGSPADLTYSAVTGSPDQYSIDFDATAEAQGFVDVVNAALPASPIVITVPGAQAGTYNATLSVINSSTGCSSAGAAISVGVIANPTITLGANPAVCFGTATADLTYSAMTETPDLYSIDFDATAEAQGFVDVVDEPLPASPIVITVPGTGAAGTYNAVVTVTNTTTSCGNGGTAITVTINPELTVSYGITPATCDENDGAITAITGGGGTGGYEFSLDGGQNFQTTASFDNLAGGSYTLTVMDDSGCRKDFPVDVTFPGFIPAAINKSNADCSNNGLSGAISVSISDPGSYRVALSTDEFNEPEEDAYQPYADPFVTFGSLPVGQYYVYLLSNSAACPTRTNMIDITGPSQVSFDLQQQCAGSALTVALADIAGDDNSPFEVRIYEKTTAGLIQSLPFASIPATARIELDNASHAFLQTPGDYQVQIVQHNMLADCDIVSTLRDFTVPEPLTITIGITEKSFPDIPNGVLQVAGISGGVTPYYLGIELDSASSFELPSFSAESEEVIVNGDGNYERTYESIPPGRYVVVVVDSMGCSATEVARVPMDERLFIPNIFTPNEDGTNDAFYIRNLPVATGQVRLVITSRWGKQIFASDNYQNNWRAEGAADGVYFYQIQIANAAPITGWVEVLRGQ